MTIVFCKPYLRAEAQRKLANGAFHKMVLEHIAEHGESPNNAHNVRYHGDAATVTVWNAEVNSTISESLMCIEVAPWVSP